MIFICNYMEMMQCCRVVKPIVKRHTGSFNEGNREFQPLKLPVYLNETPGIP